LADFTNMQIQTTIPFLSVDMAAATLVTGLLEFSRESDHAILIGSKFFGEEMVEQAKSHFLLVPDLDSIPELFKELGVTDYDEREKNDKSRDSRFKICGKYKYYADIIVRVRCGCTC